MKRSMRISALIMAALTLVLLFAGCGTTDPANTPAGDNVQQSDTPQGQTGETSEPNQSGDLSSLKVGIASRETTGDVNRDIIAGAQEYFEELGASVTVTDGQGDPQKHNENIESLINSDINILLINYGDADQLAPLVQKARDKGIIVVTGMIGSTIEGVTTDVSGDEVIMVALMGRALLNSIDYKGNVYVIYVPGAPLLESRKRMFEAIAADYPEVNLIDVPTEHNPAKVQTQIEEIMTANPEEGSIAGIWCAYDLLGSGAAEAIRQAGRGDEIKMCAIDGDRIGFQMLMTEGSPFVATVAMDMKGIGVLEATQAIKAYNGEENLAPTAYTTCWIATRHNCVEAAEMRYGESFWEDSGLDKSEIEAMFPQNDSVLAIRPSLP